MNQMSLSSIGLRPRAPTWFCRGSLEIAWSSHQASRFRGHLASTNLSGEAVELASIELMLVPALAVDEKGNRLGKGKGFYDRVLGSLRGLSVAVVFDSEVIEGGSQ